MSGLSTRVRLALAAALCVLPLGLVWSTSAGFLTSGYVIYGDCGYTADEYCTTDSYVPGYYLPGSRVLGADASARVFLVFAALVLGYIAVRTRTAATRRLARAATVSAGIALALAVSQRATLTIACLAGALLLVVPLVWRTPGKSGVFVPGPRSR
ncbi:MAG: hypothetical protein QOJ34_939 [Pseudonocardiales bacterium]|jgi:hypothetical protein|nr:hypothetical protein [Pseudonocardiales bacterium]